jgi:hypothetical protein
MTAVIDPQGDLELIAGSEEAVVWVASYVFRLASKVFNTTLQPRLWEA